MGIKKDLITALENHLKGKQQVQMVLDRIKGGESTGDSLKDFLLISYGGLINPELEHKYRSFLGQLNSHQEQPVLITYSHTEQISKGGCFGSPLYNEFSVFNDIGVISGEPSFRIDATEGHLLTIPMQKHLQQGTIYGRYSCEAERWEKKDGPLTVPVTDLPHLSGFEHLGYYHNLPKAEIISGHLNVALYLIGGRDMFQSYANAPTFSSEEQLELLEMYSRDTGRKQTYTGILALLGIEVPSELKEKIKIG